MVSTPEKFESRPIPVLAHRLFVDTPIAVPGEGVKYAQAGMWVVQGKGGAVLLVPDDIFREMYKPVTTAAEAMWKETTKTVWPIWPTGMEPEAS